MTQPYYDRIREWAIELGSDGCTGVTNAFRHCCEEHDCHWRTGRTINGRRISKKEADERFFNCMVRSSRWGYFNVLAWWRYFVVTRIQRPKRSWTRV